MRLAAFENSKKKITQKKVFPFVLFLCSFHREMYKRAQGRTRIGKKNFKKRWFCLTSRELTYHKQQGSSTVFCDVSNSDVPS